MEQIRQILSQLALHLELNIAMCDMLEKQNNRLDKLEPIVKAHSTKIDSLYTRLSEMQYTLANKAYEDRTGEKSKK